MILAIISALICFIAAIIIFSPYFRKVPLLRPMALYLIFEGAWQLASFIIFEIHPTSTLPAYIDRIGTIVIIAYYIFILLMTKSKSKRKGRKALGK